MLPRSQWRAQTPYLRASVGAWNDENAHDEAVGQPGGCERCARRSAASKAAGD